MPVSRARQRRAIITASAVLLLAAVGTARANDDFYRHHSREHAGKSRVYGNSAVHRHTPRHTHSRLNLHRSSNDPWARRWSRVHDEQQRFEPYGQGYYSLYTRSRDPYRYGYYGSHYDLSLYERFYLDRYLGAGSCGPIVSSAACSLPPADTLDPVHRSGAPGLRLHSARAFEPSFSLEAELIEIYEASGWTPLSDGRADDALRRFANLVERSPNRGVPRVGLALATAEIGDRARGAELMREALRVENGALYDVPLDDRLRERLAVLERHYAAAESGVDAHFMRAALSYLREENDAARTSIECALARGDDSESSTALRRLIARHPRR